VEEREMPQDRDPRWNDEDLPETQLVEVDYTQEVSERGFVVPGVSESDAAEIGLPWDKIFESL
jgi:hypothetical protein